MVKLIKNVVFFIIVALLIYSLTKNIFLYQKKIAFYHDFKKDYEKEVEKRKTIQSEILKNQDYYLVEKNIREKLNLLKEDEIAIILPKITPTPSPTPEIQKPPYQQWIELFLQK